MQYEMFFLVNNVDELRVSIDSVDGHDKIRGTKGAYKKAVNSIILARKKAIPVSINAVMTRKSFNQMEKLCKLAKRLDCKITFSPVNLSKYVVSLNLPSCTAKLNTINKNKFIS